MARGHHINLALYGQGQLHPSALVLCFK